MKVVPAITAMLFLLTTTTLLPTDQAARAQEGKAKAALLTRAEFCTRWHKICVRCDGLGATVPRERCLQNCTNRLAACRNNGCYHFINPRARCMNNPEDMELARKIG